MKCPNCGETLVEGALFCGNCGQKVEMSTPVDTAAESVPESGNDQNAAPVNTAQPAIHLRPVCGKCGAEYDEGDEFCGNCGNDLRKEKKEEKKEEKTKKMPALFNRKKGDNSVKADDKGKKKFPAVILAAAAAAVIVIVLLIIFIPGNSKKKNGCGILTYLKDNEIMVKHGKENLSVCDEAFKDDDDVYNCGYAVDFSEDNSKIFYPSDFDGDSFDLFVRKVNSNKDDEYKIDSNVYTYALLGNNKVIYRKGDMGSKLYISDLKGNRQKVATDVSAYYKSEDNKKIIYVTYKSDEYDLYWVDAKLKNPAVKIESGIDNIIAHSDNFDIVYYTKNDSVYICRDLVDTEKIASHVSNYYATEGEDGKIYLYYVVDKNEMGTVSVSQFVNDDVEGDSYEEQAIMERIESELGTFNSQKLYYYTADTAQPTLLADGDFTYGYGNEGAFIYRASTGEADGKMKLSELMGMSSDEIEKEIEWAKAGASVLRANIFGKDITIQVDTNDNIWNSDDSYASYDAKNKTLYLGLVNPKDYSECTLYKTSAEGDGELTLVCENFAKRLLSVGGNVYYVADEDEDGGDLYVNGTYLDSEVSYIVKSEDEKKILYAKDVDDNLFSLMYAKGKKAVKIADDVWNYVDSENGDVAVLTDYDFDNYEGDLMLFHNKDLTRVDTDVNYILRFR